MKKGQTYAPLMNIPLEDFRQICYEVDGVMTSLANRFNINYTNMYGYYFAKRPKLKEVYEEVKQDLEHQKVKKFFESLHCDTYQDALKYLGFHQNTYLELFHKHVSDKINPGQFFTARRYYRAIQESNTLTEAAGKLGVTLSALSHFKRRVLDKLPEDFFEEKAVF